MHLYTEHLRWCIIRLHVLISKYIITSVSTESSISAQRSFERLCGKRWLSGKCSVHTHGHKEAWRACDSIANLPSEIQSRHSSTEHWSLTFLWPFFIVFSWQKKGQLKVVRARSQAVDARLIPLAYVSCDITVAIVKAFCFVLCTQ